MFWQTDTSLCEGWSKSFDPWHIRLVFFTVCISVKCTFYWLCCRYDVIVIYDVTFPTQVCKEGVFYWCTYDETRNLFRAQRESTWRCKFDWGELGGWNSPSSTVTWLELKCITIHRTCIVNTGWANIIQLIVVISGPKFIKQLTENTLLYP